MLDSFELEINKYLRAGRPAEDVARSLRDLWDRGGLSHYDQNVIAMFLARSGNIEHLFHVVQNCIEKETRVPWLAILEAFRIGHGDVTKTIMDYILVGCGVENRLGEIAFATAGDELDPRFKKLRQQAWAEHNLKRDAELEAALEKLAELRRDRMFDAEEKFLERLYSQYPTHPKLAREFNEMHGRRARDLLDRRHRDSRHARLIHELIDPHLEEVLDPLDQQWAENFVVLAEQRKHMAYDLAIALLQMNLPKLAAKTLDHAPTSRDRDSLIMDLMVENRQFVDALDFADRFDETYHDHSDTAFAAMYARARALWGLGAKIDGVKMLEGLLKLRPTYRSAQALLTEWKGAQE